jgi:hypothetical protein
LDIVEAIALPVEVIGDCVPSTHKVEELSSESKKVEESNSKSEMCTHKVEELRSESEMVEEVSSESEMWRDAILEESQSLHLKVIGCTCVCANLEGSRFDIVCYKASLVAMGYVWKESMDCNEVFSYVGKHSSICVGGIGSSVCLDLV